MLEAVRALKDTYAKKREALAEGLNLDAFVTNQKIVVEQEPFAHIVVDDFFTPQFYAEIERYFKRVRARGLTEEWSDEQFHPFLELRQKGKEWEYDGYVCTPLAGDDPVLKLFFSLEWNLFFSNLFDQPTDWATAFALHHHPPGNRTGFIHNDYSAKFFSRANTLPNGVVYREMLDQAHASFASMRVIALILYLGDATPEEGGGTGLYGVKGTTPVKVVEPRANRLFAFQISPKSFHAFQTNQAERNSLIQWFHKDQAWCQKRYGHV